jgi:MSHA biogenesis protein MshJ
MIAPDRMIEAIHDVLDAQHAVALVSLHNLPALPLPAAQEGETSAEGTHPYLHRVELVLEGPYLNVLAYLAALEKLPWHFYWRHLELTSAPYPTNQVRVEIGTISPDRDWIGL